MRNIHCFDIFDTLVARRCVDPKNIFIEMECQLGIQGFAQMRINAELSIVNRSYTFNDIYQVIQNGFGLDHAKIAFLKEKEIEYEIKNAVGIKENIDKIENGDVLITDMYLPRNAILSILEKVGMVKHVGIIISSGGKYSGRVWQQLKTLIQIEQHIGDNIDSDVNSALKHGIFGHHVTSHHMSQPELDFVQAGFHCMARLIRELRLRSICTRMGNEANQQKLLQIYFNIPILLMACVKLKTLCKERGIKKLLFSSRDCFYLEKIFATLNKLCRWNLQHEYFYTSRLCRFNPSEQYIKYVKNISDENTLIVDLGGTGQSLVSLYEKVGVSPNTFFIHDFWTRYFPENSRQFNEKFFSVIQRPELRNDTMELLNYVNSGMTKDVLVMEGCESVIPIFEYPGYPDNVLTIVSRIEDIQSLLLEVIHQSNFNKLVFELEGDPDIADDLIKLLYERVSTYMTSMTDALSYHIAQDRKSSWKANGVYNP